VVGSASERVAGAGRPGASSPHFVTISGPFQVSHQLVLMLVQRPLFALFFYIYTKKIAIAGRALVQPSKSSVSISRSLFGSVVPYI